MLIILFCKFYAAKSYVTQKIPFYGRSKKLKHSNWNGHCFRWWQFKKNITWLFINAKLNKNLHTLPNFLKIKKRDKICKIYLFRMYTILFISNFITFNILVFLNSFFNVAIPLKWIFKCIEFKSHIHSKSLRIYRSYNKQFHVATTYQGFLQMFLLHLELWIGHNLPPVRNWVPMSSQPLSSVIDP